MSQSYLQFYTKIAFHNGLEKLMSEFLDNNQLLGNGFEYLKEYDYYLKDEMVIDSKDAVFVTTIINREKFLKDILLEQRKNLYDVLKIAPNSLKETLDNLNIVFAKIETQKEQKYFTIIIEELKNIVGDIILQYSSIVEHHPIYNRIKRINSSLSYFQCKELPYVFFEKLYDLTYSLDLIDDVLITEEMFTNVFSSSKPEFKIDFIKPNPIIAFYLKEIEVFFDNLKAVTIEKSELFRNKQGKLLKSSDLYTALSRGMNKNTSEKNKIKIKVEELKNMYLN